MILTANNAALCAPAAQWLKCPPECLWAFVQWTTVNQALLGFWFQWEPLKPEAVFAQLAFLANAHSLQRQQ